MLQCDKISRKSIMGLAKDSSVVCIVAVRNRDRFRQCFEENDFVQNLSCVQVDNSVENQPIPIRYNDFLDSYDYSKPAWFAFVHEDFEIRDDLVAKLRDCETDSLWGPIGCYRQSFLGIGRQKYVGCILVADSQTDFGLRPFGNAVPKGVKVETFDCCCLLVHSSLVEKYHLRFDPELRFDLYVEDFCASAYVNHGIRSRILPFGAAHHSSSVPQDRYYRHMPYLRKKYPRNCFVGTCSYFGTMPPMMRLQRWLMGQAAEDRRLGLVE